MIVMIKIETKFVAHQSHTSKALENSYKLNKQSSADLTQFETVQNCCFVWFLM